MNRDDILRLAREASAISDCNELTGDAIDRFAALVAAAEREACAKVVEGEAHMFATLAAAKSCAAAIRNRGEVLNVGEM